MLFPEADGGHRLLRAVCGDAAGRPMQGSRSGGTGATGFFSSARQADAAFGPPKKCRAERVSLSGRARKRCRSVFIHRGVP
jgi:hypothetical protein